MPDPEPLIPAVTSERPLVLITVGALGVSCVMTQLALMRELLGAFSGNEMVLGVVLGLWFLLMGLGAALGRTVDRLRNPLAALGTAQMFIAILPLAQVFLLRALRNVVFTRGSEVGVIATILGTAVLLLPYCLLAGYALTLACSILHRRGDVAGAGRVYVADSLGSIGGGALFSFVLVRWFDHLSLLVFPALLNLGMAGGIAGCLGLAARRRGIESGNRGSPPARRQAYAGSLLVGSVLAAIGVLGGVYYGKLDLASTTLQFNDFVLFHANSPYGRLVVTKASGQTNFFENGIAITSTHNVEQVEEAAHYALSQRPRARRVLLVSGSIAGVAKEILKHKNVAEVDCVELDPLVIETGRRYLPDHFADPRLRVMATDARRWVQRTPRSYDIVILALPDPSTAQLNRYFTTEFFGEVKRVLSPEGVLSFSLGHYENYVSKELARMVASACQSLKPSFQNLLLIPGGRIFYLASNGPLFDDIASRIEQQQISTKLVNRHYLDATLTMDRMADLTRAQAQPARVNRDFNPVLYYYHLQHWMSQFKPGFGLLPVLLLVGLGVYLARLRGPAFVLFASGFAGSALEFVLLLTFQVLCGSVYHQVGIIVTVFMAGLALGSGTTNSIEHHNGQRTQGPTEPLTINHQPSRMAETLFRKVAAKFTGNGRKSLAALAFAIAGYAVLLLLLLPLLNRMRGARVSDFIAQAAIALLTLVLAALVGMQFPLANRLAFDGTVTGASRLYTADFFGAFLGALLTCALLIPLLGVTGACLLAAALNVLGGAMISFQKAVT